MWFLWIWACRAARVKKHKFEDEEDYGKALRENIEKTEAAVHAALKVFAPVHIITCLSLIEQSTVRIR